MRTKPLATFALVGASLAALAACNSRSSSENAATATAANDSGTASSGAVNVAGPAIRVVGSSTVYPFTTAVAESFKRKYPSAATPIVESTGTGGGFKLFCGGVGLDHPDLEDASRAIKASEADLCRKNGVDKIAEIQVGIDGIAIAQSNSDQNLALTPRQVFLALAATKPDGSKNTAKTWHDVDPALPARKIEVLGPPPTSGTRDAFGELVMEAGCKTFDNLKALKATNEDEYKSRCTKLREDGGYIEAGENDNLIVQKLVSDPTALGIFGYSYLEKNLDKIEGVKLGGIAPTYDAVADGSYPASRPLFIYVKVAHMQAKPALRAFLDEYTSDAAWGPDGYLKARGLITSPDDVRARNASIAADLKPIDLASVK